MAGDPQFPFELLYESSPVESLTGSNETESEEEEGDDYMAGLARRVARWMLEDEDATDDSLPAGHIDLHHEEKSRMASMGPLSPQSMASSWSSTTTLFGSKSSSRVSSQVSSPSTPFRAKDDAWDLIRIASGEDVRLQSPEDSVASSNGFLHCSSMKPISNGLRPASWAQSYSSLFSTQLDGLQTNSCLSSSVPSPDKDLAVKLSKETQLQHYQHSLKQAPKKDLDKKEDLHSSRLQQFPVPKRGSTPNRDHQSKPVQQQYVNMANRSMQKAGSSHQASSPSHSYQRSPNQPIGGVGTRAVFLGSNGSQRECCGTGVFLPRSHRHVSDSRKKPSRSTVLLPARVVKALNLNVGDMHSPPIYPSRRVANSQGGRHLPSSSTATRSFNVSVQPCTLKTGTECERRLRQSVQSTPEHVASEAFLPNEWTY